jgi:succinate dehydrogenase flavin-adding protein (antitoxin of CptAB toxin-antitoxin module)
MLELDILLNDFLDQGYEGLEQQERVVFQRLLEYSDQSLIQLLMGQTKTADRECQNVLKKIRGNQQVSS